MKLLQDAFGEIEVKKSRFLCFLHKTDSETEAKEWLKELKKAHPGARHFCTAMRLGNTVRSNDDGEPSGTAGRPILSVLTGADLDDVFCVVIRYFGGTLLGTGGLVKAYSDAVKMALDTAILTESRPVRIYMVSVPYGLSGKFSQLVARHTVIEEEYGQDVTWTVGIVPEQEEAFLSDCAALSRGTVVPVFVEEKVEEAVIEP